MSKILSSVMIVDDEPDIQAIARLSLESVGGFSVEACNSGQEALDRATGIQPDLIILDVMMPGLDGPATLRELKKLPELAKTPIIFMTASVEPHEVQKYKDMGVLDVIAKPFNPMTLPDIVRSIWEDNHN